ncbi:MAG TPA: FAD-dependent 5-carboxymethylaminomethyl-2-thiouridine(34) oxidoreductase MnmC, partial [Caldimonas sp.]
MNTAPIRPAAIVRDADGTPRSADYGDLYHPRGGALAQARHVFLNGDGLAERWRGRERFVVLETGFGLGNNFLATWSAWRADPQRCRQLHFLSIEATPPSQADFRAAARDPALAPLAAELADRWPPLTWNLHRRSFDADRVELLLAFGDIAAWLPQLVARVDAFFLDGFAPARNPAMWDGRLFKAMARLAAADATVATWTAARAVRDGLRSAGFVVEAAAGSGGKRDITRARFAPRFTPRPAPRQAMLAPSAKPAWRSTPAGGATRPVVIVGAGLAGCALAGALAERGRSSLLLERQDDVAREGSGNAAGLFHGVVHRIDGRHARFHRAAASAARDAVQEAIRAHGVRGSVAGLLRVEFGATGRDALQAIVDALGLPPDCVQALDAKGASELAGVPLSAPAWHHPHGGWVDPRGLARAALARAGGQAELRTGCAIASLRHEAGEWLLLDETGVTVAAADAVALCNAGGAFDLLGGAPWPVERQRGQTSGIAVTHLPANAIPRLPLTGVGYALPAIDGTVWFGASAQWNDSDAAVRPADHLDNLERLARLVGLPAWAPRIGLDDIDGRTGFRWQSRDRLPIIGAVPAALAVVAGFAGPATAPRRLDQPRLVPRAPGLFVFSALGSRGIASSTLGAQLLAAAIAGAPSPVEADLLDAVDPARFLVRRFRHDDAS